MLVYAQDMAGTSLATSVMGSAPHLSDWQMIAGGMIFQSVILGPDTALGAGIVNEMAEGQILHQSIIRWESKVEDDSVSKLIRAR